MQLEDMSTAELIALVKRQEQELAAAKAEGAVSKAFGDLMTFGNAVIQVTHIPYEGMLAQPVQQPAPECGACQGSGWVSRDADIGTEQECPSCGGSGDGEVAPVAAPVYVPAASVQPATVTLDGHQLRMALDFINPDGLDDRDQMDNDLTFGVRQHQGDDGTISIGMCCWNDDSDGVLPLDGEYPDLAKDNCPTCGNSWADHEFAVPAPYCPEPRKATTKQPGSGRDAALVDEADLECQVPPHGWRCTRGAGHSGPCAAVEYPEDIEAVKRGMERLAAHPANVAQVGELNPSPDQVVETNVALMRQRSAVGVEKYGTTLADSGLPVRALLVHALEESIDMANYIQAVIQQTDALAAKKGPTT